jgi:nucleoside-triphosphatase THEP1
MIADVLASEKRLIATIALKGGGLIANLKKRSDAQLFTVTRNNQGILFDQIVTAVSLWE